MPLDHTQPGRSSAQLLANSGGVLITMNALSQGGANRVAVILANGFVDARIPTRLVLMRDEGGAENELKSLLHADVSVVSAGKPMGIPLSKSLPAVGHQHLERLRGVRHICREIFEFDPAVVLAASDDMAFTTALARRLSRRRPAFAMKLTSTLFRPRTPLTRRLQRLWLFDFVFRQYDLVITLSEAQRRELAKLYPSHRRSFLTLPNPYVSARMLREPRNTRRDGGAMIVTAGRFVRSKRLDVMLRAFAQIEDKAATLTLLGDGPLKQDLVNLANSLGISHRVRMPGFVEDVVPWLKKSDLFLLTSDYEGLPAALIEALACNVPVVTTDSFPAVGQLVGQTDACAVVPRDDPHSLGLAIDARLRRVVGTAENFQEITAPYHQDKSISAHIAALAELADRRSDRGRAQGRRQAENKPTL